MSPVTNNEPHKNMTYSITNTRRDNDKIFVSVNGVEYIIRKSGGAKYGSVSLQTAICGGELCWAIRCHRFGKKATNMQMGWKVTQVAEIA